MIVKICGIRTLEAAKTAADGGADFLGFNFVLSSKRFINLSKALEIIGKISKNIKTVGVFQNERSDLVNFIAEKLKLDYVQLHGKESPEYCRKIRVNIIKTFVVKKVSTVQNLLKEMKEYEKILRSGSRPQNDNKRKVLYYLLDREEQGKGDMIDPNIVKKLSLDFPIILAGGLTPLNVKEAVSEKLCGVDVASGIETNGEQDLGKIEEFIRKAKLFKYE